MNRSEQRIVAAARRVRGLCPSLEAEALCAALDVSLLRTDLGTEADSIKGFLLRSNRCSTAVINSALPPELQRVILFHELGHAVLGHPQGQVHTFMERYLYQSQVSSQENEANFFAAELLLTDEETLETLSHVPFDQAAASLRVPPEILDFKCRMLQKKGRMAYEDRLRAVTSDCLRRVCMEGGAVCCQESFI